jgi:hypothetical protein
MADSVACLASGKLLVLEAGRVPLELESPYLAQVGARERALRRKHPGPPRAPARSAEQTLPLPRIVGVTRGRVNGELCYAVSTGVVSGIFAQKPGRQGEQRLFHNADVLIRELNFSFAEEAFTCAVDGKDGTSAIGILADDGKGVRTVTEGDVLDRAPRWMPGGVREIVYASAGIGRTKAGAWAGRAPFSLQRLSLNDGTVEVLVSDAKYDYLAPIAASGSLLYAIRRGFVADEPKRSLFDALSGVFRARGNAPPKAAERMLVWDHWLELGESAAEPCAAGHDRDGYELVRITPKSTEVLARGVLAFDVAPAGDIVYSSGTALYRLAPDKGSTPQQLAELERVEQVVVY